MIFDRETLFSYQQDVSINVGTALSDKSIDAGTVGTLVSRVNTAAAVGLSRDAAKGTPVQVFVRVDADLDSATDDCTLKVELITADDEALTSNLVVIAESATIAQATLVEGYELPLVGALPPGIGADRYIGLRYNIGTANASAGAVTAGLRLHQG